MTIFYRAVDAGPLTTTFTPPPDCTGTNIDGPPYYVFTNLGPVSCEPPDNFNSCRPGTTRSRLETEDGYTYQPLPTYSPGLICPAHWTTATTITGTTRDPEAYSSREEDIFRNVFSLKETDTLVLCCPSGLTFETDMCLGPPETALATPYSTYCGLHATITDNALFMTSPGRLDEAMTSWTQIDTLEPTETAYVQIQRIPLALAYNAEDLAAARASRQTGSDGAKETGGTQRETPVSTSASASAASPTATEKKKSLGVNLKSSVYFAAAAASMVAAWTALFV